MSPTKDIASFKMLQRFETEYSPNVFTQYESERTGMRVVVVDQEGPKVNGFFALATEIHDDSGSPHTLEHLVFMGSKSYKYKGLLDKLATRAYSATNAWTATDHTAYTLSTAGWEGFAQILPVYLEHVLLPTLTDAGCYTEVHHIDGTGNDAGVVYAEMQRYQNDQKELMELKARRLIYPENVGFRYETGGMTEQLRVLTADRIRAFHREMYQPKNLCLVLIGEIDHTELLQILDKSEGDISQDIPKPDAPWKRPWIESPQPPPLKESVIETVEFPEEDESSGEILIGFLGPDANDPLLSGALSIILVYLAGSSVSVLENILVEREQVASAASYSTDNRPDTLIWFMLSSVATKKLAQVEKRFFEILRATASNPLDMDYIRDCIHRQKRRLKSEVEASAVTFSEAIINDFLFGKKDGSTLRDIATLREFDELEGWTDQRWRNFLKEWISDAAHVSILGKPSEKLSEQIKADEEKRVEEQKKRLGEDGLKRLAKKLDDAKAENEVELPPSLLEKFKVPGTDSIHFIKTTTARSGSARKMGELDNEIQRVINHDQPETPLFLHFEHIPSNFVHLTMVISTDSVPTHLRPLLPVYLDNFFNTPVLRGGEKIDFEQIVTQLEKVTVEYDMDDGASHGNTEVLRIHFQIEPDKYQTAIAWLKEMLWTSIFDGERLKASVAKLLASVPDEKRDGFSMATAVRTMIHYAPGSVRRACNVLVKALYLKRVNRLLQRDPERVRLQFEEVRTALCRFENLRVLVVADLHKLKTPVASWQPFLEGLDTSKPLNPIDWPGDRLSEAGRQHGNHAYIIPMPTEDSSYSLHNAKGLDSYNHPQYPALTVALAYLDAVEGPLWSAVRGTGLAYGTGFGKDIKTRLLQFYVYRSPDAYKAFAASRKVIEEFVDGTREFEPLALEGAISTIVVSFADEQPSMRSAANLSFINQVIRGVRTDYNEQMLKKVRQVSVEELKNVMKTVVLPVFLPGKSDIVLTCAPVLAENMKNGFEADGFKVEIQPLSFFQDDYGLKVDGDDDDDDEEDEMLDGEEDEQDEHDEHDEHGGDEMNEL